MADNRGGGAPSPAAATERCDAYGVAGLTVAKSAAAADTRPTATRNTTGTLGRVSAAAALFSEVPRRTPTLTPTSGSIVRQQSCRSLAAAQRGTRRVAAKGRLRPPFSAAVAGGRVAPVELRSMLTGAGSRREAASARATLALPAPAAGGRAAPGEHGHALTRRRVSSRSDECASFARASGDGRRRPLRPESACALPAGVCGRHAPK